MCRNFYSGRSSRRLMLMTLIRCRQKLFLAKLSRVVSQSVQVLQQPCSSVEPPLNESYNRRKGVARIFFIGGQDRRPRAGVGFLGRGQQPPPHQLGGMRSAVSSSTAGFGPKGFPLFSALRMASPES